MSDIEWIEWAGGECPVDVNVDVEVRLRGGGTNEMSAMSFDWYHVSYDAESDIVAYRVLA